MAERRLVSVLFADLVGLTAASESRDAEELVLLGLLLLAVRVKGRLEAAVALAVLLPVVFLLSNRVFSPQFLVLLVPAWAIAGALVAYERREQLAVGVLAGGASRANVLVYPVLHARWWLFSAALFAPGFLLSALLVARVWQAPVRRA